MAKKKNITKRIYSKYSFNNIKKRFLLLGIENEEEVLKFLNLLPCKYVNLIKQTERQLWISQPPMMLSFNTGSSKQYLQSCSVNRKIRSHVWIPATWEAEWSWTLWSPSLWWSCPCVPPPVSSAEWLPAFYPFGGWASFWLGSLLQLAFPSLLLALWPYLLMSF